jgi:hypothetical protein
VAWSAAVNFRSFTRSWLFNSPWLLLSVPALGLIELLGHLYFRERTPKLDDYSQLEPEVEKLRGPGELVTVSPYWAEPNLRWALGDSLMPLADVARPDDSRYPAVVEVLLPGHATEFSKWELETVKEVGKFRIEKRNNPDYTPVLYDFGQHLKPGEAEVELRHGSEVREVCGYNRNARVSNGALGGHPTFPKERFQCGKEEWDFVGSTVIEDQNYRPRRCIWAHPSPGSVTKVIRFPKAKLGKEIAGYLGIPYLVDREQKGKPVTLSVSVAGEVVGQAEHNQGQGWHSFALDTTKFAGTEQAVEFRVDAKSIRYRTLCFHADVR